MDMTTTSFEFGQNLPANTHLLPKSRLDHRSDDEIFGELATYRPVTSTKNIWAFWNTGWENLKPWCKRNVTGWARRQSSEWTIRILDRVDDSPNNVYKYLPSTAFPPAFNEDRMEGPYVGAHSADLVRLPCLYHYGGVWLDVSIMLLRTIEDICWNQLTAEDHPAQIAGFVLPNVHGEHQIAHGYMENWFIAAAKPHNEFIGKWHAVFAEYWSDITESKDAKQHALFEHLDTEGFRQDMIDYLAQHLSFYRVRTLVDASTGWHGPRFFQRHMLLMDAREEGYHLPTCTEYNGPECFDLLAQQKPKDGSDRGSRAEEITSFIISNSSLTKSVHGFKGNTQLSDLWNLPENENADIAEGTYAEYLRAASRYLEQDRDIVPLAVDAESSHREATLHARLLQPRRDLGIQDRKDLPADPMMQSRQDSEPVEVTT